MFTVSMYDLFNNNAEPIMTKTCDSIGEARRMCASYGELEDFGYGVLCFNDTGRIIWGF